MRQAELDVALRDYEYRVSFSQEHVLLLWILIVEVSICLKYAIFNYFYDVILKVTLHWHKVSLISFFT